MISHSSWFDALFILRSLRRSKTLATLIVATIALVSAALRSLPASWWPAWSIVAPNHRPDRVVGLQLTAPSLLYPRIYFANEDYIALRNSTVADDGIFDALLPLGIAYVMMTGGGEPSHLNAGVMPAETFARLGVQPLLGRPLGAGDERPDATAVVVISEEVWRQAFSGDPAVLGRVVKIEDIPHEIVGVMPARFTWGALTAWLPMRPDLYGKVTGPSVQIAGWLRDGVSELEAAARLKVLFSSLAASRGGRYPASPGITLGHPGLPVVRDEVRRGLLLLLTAVMLLGIVGCVNAGALLLARTTGRLKELGVRLSLGASRWQIVRLQLIEAAILTCTGAVAGVILATAILPSLKIMLPPGVLPLGADVRLEWRVLTLISVAALLMGLIASVLPAWLVTRRDVEPHLRQTATGSSVTLGSVGLWRTLIGIEVAMAMTLLVLTAVFARGLFALQAEPLGYAPERVVALGVTISEHRYPQHSAGGEFLRRAVERIRAIPGAPTLPPAAAARPRDVLPLVAAWHRAMGNAFAAKASPPTEASRLDDLAMHTAWLAGLAHTLANRTERTQ